MTDRSQAAIDVLAERRRQVEAEGWTPAHDDAYLDDELVRAAGSYLRSAVATDRERATYQKSAWPLLGEWPWARVWWKPTTRRRDLVEAGALILAEIERIDRATKQQGGPDA